MRQVRMAAHSVPDTAIVIRAKLPLIKRETVPEPVFDSGAWVERQKKIPLPPSPKKSSWFSIIEEIEPLQPIRPTVEQIQRVVCLQYNISRNDFLSPRRTADVVWARQIAMYLSKSLTLRTLPEIGRKFGGRDHTTVLHAVRKIADLYIEGSELASEIDKLKRLLCEMST